MAAIGALHEAALRKGSHAEVVTPAEVPPLLAFGEPVFLPETMVDPARLASPPPANPSENEVADVITAAPSRTPRGTLIGENWLVELAALARAEGEGPSGPADAQVAQLKSALRKVG